MFNIKKNKNKEIVKMTVEELKKAYESLSEEDKKLFDESQGEPEEAKQGKALADDASDKEENATKANESSETKVEDNKEQDNQDNSKNENGNEMIKTLVERVARLETLMSAKTQDKKADKEEVDKLSECEARWNN